MKATSLLTQDDKTVRTQITLTKKLKQLVEEKAHLRGESLSEYLRRAALVTLLVEEDKKEERRRLAKIMIGSVNLKKNPQWSNKKKIRGWVRKLRREWK